MYYFSKFVESVRIPPNAFGKKLNSAALDILREQYERTVAREHGVIVSLHDAKIAGNGRIIPGDGAAYFDVEFSAMVFTPEINEIVIGEVSEIVDFGAFVRLGPIDGLVHVSQVADDFFTMDKKKGVLVGKKSKQVIKKGDVVKAKITTVSFKDNIPNSKIALTMRPSGLGKEK
ncbi:DNA-directed RNA polymerase [Candidatus Micrarchaeota archaeon]|nr:DNA-directed RNA polymerase [Candidatus Micrarchaeota archaeon]MBI5177269.1 DNA-directed RNA polymerase [Candidatus Micrarchaeota archaeon]